VHQGRQQFGWARGAKRWSHQSEILPKQKPEIFFFTLWPRAHRIYWAAAINGNIQALAGGSSAIVKGSDGGATSAEVDGQRARGGAGSGKWVLRPESPSGKHIQVSSDTLSRSSLAQTDGKFIDLDQGREDLFIWILKSTREGRFMHLVYRGLLQGCHCNDSGQNEGHDRNVRDNRFGGRRGGLRSSWGRLFRGSNRGIGRSWGLSRRYGCASGSTGTACRSGNGGLHGCGLRSSHRGRRDSVAKFVEDLSFVGGRASNSCMHLREIKVSVRDAVKNGEYQHVRVSVEERTQS
jgi:hypothetical protein